MELEAQIYQLKDTEKGSPLTKLSFSELNPLEILMSKAFLQGESLFTSLLMEKNKPWFMRDHLDRLLQSFQWHYDYPAILMHKMRESIELELSHLSFGPGFYYLRLTFFESLEKRFFVLLTKPHPDPRAKLSSLKLKTHIPGSKQAQRRSHKWGNYLDSNLLKKNFSSEEDLLYLDDDKKVLELSSSNIFFSDGKSLFTPLAKGRILPGVYRKNLISLLKDKGFPLIEQEIALSDLSKFKFAFATNCLSGIREIHSIDHHVYQEKDSEFLINLKKDFY